MKLATKAGQETSLELNHAAAIVASDTVDIDNVGALIHCNQTGNYNVLLTAMDTPVKLFLVAGVSYPLRIKRLYVTDTDYVTGLIALLSVNTQNDTR
jgi:hypothetical protein